MGRQSGVCWTQLIPVRQDPNVLWIFYEDLVENLEASIEIIAGKLLQDICLSHHIVRNLDVSMFSMVESWCDLPVDCCGVSYSE